MRINRQSTESPGKNEPLKLGLSKRAIEALGPGPRRYLVHDARCPGLAVCVFETGTKSFLFYRKVNGRPVKVTLGRFPSMTLEDARKRVAALHSEAARGEDPAEKRRMERAKATVGQLWISYLEKHCKPHCKPLTWRKYDSLYRTHLEHWQHRKASSLEESEIAEWHVKIAGARTRGRKTDHGKRATYQSNRALALLRAILNHGKVSPNPCVGVKKFKEESRDRFLKVDELPRLLASLEEDENQTFADVIRTCLLTGARQANVRMMKWDQVDLPNRTWRIPDTKSGTPQNVPLSPPAVELLEHRKSEATGPWVFPGKGGESFLKYPKSTWARVLKRAGIEGLRLHDLRRTAGSWMLAGGASLPTIQKTLGHKSIQTTMTYARTEDAAVRAAMDAVGAAMFGTGEGGES